MEKKKRIQIIALVLVLLCVLGVFALKKAAEKKADESTPLALMQMEIDLPKLTSKQLPLIVNFSADGCPSCALMEDDYAALHTETAEAKSAVLVAIDVWKNTHAADAFPVSVIPTQMFVNADGSPYMPSEAVAAKYQFDFYQKNDAHAYTMHTGVLDEAALREILADMSR